MSISEIELGESALPELQEIDGLINQSLSSSCSGLGEMVDHLMQKSGKKLRPILVLQSAGLLGKEINSKRRNNLLKVAAAAELIHTASLVHDDIIDGAEQRRGNATLHQRWNKHKAVLVGDFLLARAFALLCDLELNQILLPLFSRSVALLCQGEARQLAKTFAWDMSEREYFQFNYLKTSQLLAACCEAGGRVVQAFPVQIRALRLYGYNMGQAFQIVDDILDYADNPGQLGKPVGSDLSQGVVTLPLIYMLRTEKRYQGILRTITARRPELFPGLIGQIRQAVKSSGALHSAFQRALQCRDSALESLLQFPPTCSRHLMAAIAEAVTGRASFAGDLAGSPARI